jgi:hypothetical protein
MATKLSLASLLALVSALFPCTSAASQQAERLSPGMRVRLQVIAAPRATGTIVSTAAGSFGFQAEGGSDTIFVDYARIQRIDVSQGRHHRIVRDAILGGIGGLVVGGVIGAASHANFPGSQVIVPPPPDDPGSGCTIRDPTCTDPSPPPQQQPKVVYREPTGADLQRTAKGAAIGAAAGAIAGAILGRLIKSEVWKKLPPDRYRVNVALAPSCSRRVKLDLRFGVAIR